MSTPARATAAALVAAGICVSGVMCTGAAAAAATRSASLTAVTRPASLAAVSRSAAHPGAQPRYPQTLTVTSLANTGPGSLRAAITRANLSLPGRPTLIRFAVRGTITLSSPLPPVSANMIINGASAPGYVRGGAPVVEIDASGQAGLEFAPGCRVRSCWASRWTTPAVTASRWRPAISPSTATTSASICPAHRSAMTGTGFSLRLRRGEHDRRESGGQVRSGRQRDLR